MRDDVDTLLGSRSSRRQRRGVSALLERGVAGTAVIPGKHGGPVRRSASCSSPYPTIPASWPGCLADAGEIGVNIEDLRIDHDPGRPVGLVELDVADEAVTTSGVPGGPRLDHPPLGQVWSVGPHTPDTR